MNCAMTCTSSVRTPSTLKGLFSSRAPESAQHWENNVYELCHDVYQLRPDPERSFLLTGTRICSTLEVSVWCCHRNSFKRARLSL